MASAVDDAPIEAEVLSEEEPTAVVDEIASPRPKNGSASASSKTAFASKSTVPPKRPLTTTAPKRPTAPTPSSASKTNSVTSSRLTHGSTLSKPPARPPASSSTARRPTTTAISTTSSHRARASISSTDELKKGPTSPSAEPKRAMVAGTAKRASLTPAAASRLSENKPPVGTVRRSLAGSMPTVDKKPVTSVPLKFPTDSARSSTLSSPRTARASSTTSKVPSSTTIDGKKRLSTIPASPAVQPAESRAKPTRPELGKRKSTMSAPLEQRLKEMELVHDMLRIAMAEDGDDGDEVKEEYARQMDENIASLKERLEESRRSEDKDPLPQAAEKAEVKDLEPTKESSDVQAELTATQDKVAALEAELVTAKENMIRFSEEAKQASKDVADATEGVRREHTAKIDELISTHAAEVEALKAEFENKEKQHKSSLQDTTEGIRQDHIAKIDELNSAHAAEVEALKAELESRDKHHKSSLQDAMDGIRQEHAGKMDELTSAHTTEVERLKSEFADRAKDHESSLQDATEGIRRKLTVQMDELTSAHATEAEKLKAEMDGLTSARATEIEKLTAKMDELTSTHATKVENLTAEMDGLTSAHSTEIEKLKAELENREKDHRLSLQDATESIKQEHATNTNELMSNHATEVEKLKAELADREKGLESSLLEASKERTRELDRLKQEHSAEISRLETVHTGETDKLQVQLAEKEDIYKQHVEKSLRDLEEAKAAVDQQGSEEASRLLEEQTQKHAEALRSVETKLEDQQQQGLDAASKIDEMTKQLTELQDRLAKAEKDSSEADTMRRTLEDTLQQKDEALNSTNKEITDLQAQLQERSAQADKDSSEANTVRQNLEATVQQKEEALDSMKQEFTDLQARLVSLQAEEKERLEEIHTTQKHLEEKGQQKEEALKSMEKEVSDLKAQLDSLHSTHAELDKTYAERLASLQSTHAELDKTYAESTERLRGVEADHQVSRQRIIELEASAGSTSAQHDEVLAAKDAEFQNLTKAAAAQHSESLAAKEAELQTATEKFEAHSTAKTAEIEALKEKIKALDEAAELTATEQDKLAITNVAEMEKMGAMVERLELELKNAIKSSQEREEAQTQCDLLTKRVSDMEAAAEDEMTKYQATISEKAREMEQLNAAIEGLQGQVQQAHESTRQELDESRKSMQTDHAATIEELQAKQGLEIESAIAQAKQALQHELNDATEQIVGLKRALDTLEEAGLGKDQEHASAAQKFKNDSHERDVQQQQSKVQIAELSAKLLSAEHKIDSLGHEVTDASEQHRTEITELKQRLADEVERHEKQRQSGAEVRDKLALQVEELETLKRSRSDGDAQLQQVLDKERDQNSRLKGQLEDASSTIERHAARVREVEAALKATNAEITELKTKVTTEVTDNADASEAAEDVENSERGSHIEGAMAGLQAQLKALEGINDDMIGDHQRMVNMLTRPTSSSTNKSLTPRGSRSVLSPLAPSFNPTASSSS